MKLIPVLEVSSVHNSRKRGQVSSEKEGKAESMEEKASIREKRWSLQGTTALVTGGTKGIGRAIVEELAGLGATVYTCSRNEAELSKCLQEWEEAKLTVVGSVCDVSSRADREKMVDRVSSMFNGKLNILVNNAGTAIRKPTVDCTAEDYSFLMATNFESAFHLCQLAHPLLKASGTGSIINISSVGGTIGIDGVAIYSATKGTTKKIFLSGSTHIERKFFVDLLYS